MVIMNMPHMDQPAIIQQYQETDVRKAKVVEPDKKGAKKSYKAPVGISQNNTHTGHLHSNQPSGLDSIVSHEFRHPQKGRRGRPTNSRQPQDIDLSNYHNIPKKSGAFPEIADRLDLKRKHLVSSISYNPDLDEIATFNQRGKIIEQRPLKRKEKGYADIFDKVLRTEGIDANTQAAEKGEKHGFNLFYLINKALEAITPDAHAYARECKLRWDFNRPEDNVTEYRVLFREAGNNMHVPGATVPGSINTATVAGLDSAITYYFIVRAARYDSANSKWLVSGDSEEVSLAAITVGPTVDLTYPTVSDPVIHFAPDGSSIGLDVDVSDASSTVTNLYINDFQVNSTTDQGELDLSDLPLEYLVNGENIFSIVSTDSAGNKTSKTISVNLALGYIPIEAGETHLSNMDLEAVWQNGGWEGVSLDAELTTDPSVVTEYKTAIVLPWVSIPKDRSVFWDNSSIPFIDLKDILQFEYDTHNPRDGDDVASKMEFWVNGGYFAIKEPFTLPGKERHILPVADMLPSQNPTSTIVNVIRSAIFNRSDLGIYGTDGEDNLTLDRFIARPKYFSETFDGYADTDELTQYWEPSRWDASWPDVELVPSATSNGNAVRIGYSYVPYNRSVSIEFELSESLGVDEIERIVFSTNNSDSNGIAYKIELWNDFGDTGYHYHSGTPLEQGIDEFDIPGSELAAKYTESKDFNRVKLSLFNRNPNGLDITQPGYVEIDDFHIVKKLITVKSPVE